MQAIKWSVHMIDGRNGGRYSVVYILHQINTLLCYTLVSVLVLGIGITRSQYYWILNIGCLANPKNNRPTSRNQSITGNVNF